MSMIDFSRKENAMKLKCEYYFAVLFASIFASPLNAFSGSAYEPAPSREWVRQYVSNALSNSVSEVANNAQSFTSNGVTSITAGIGEYTISATYEFPNVQCVTASNCTERSEAFGITNGVKWVRNGLSRYSGKSVQDIIVERERFMCGVFATVMKSLDSFYEGSNKVFDVVLSYVTESESKKIKGE